MISVEIANKILNKYSQTIFKHLSKQTHSIMQVRYTCYVYFQVKSSNITT